MKNINAKILILSVIVLFGFFVVSTPASAATCDSATLNGSVTSGTLPIRARFTYGTNYNTVLNGGGTPTAVQTFYSYGPIQQVISGLTASTTYYFRLELTNSVDTTLLSINNVTTTPCQQTQQNPTVSLYANPSTISSGQASTLTWSSSNTTSCFNSWNGNNSLSGNTTVYPTSTTNYTINCQGINGQPANASATVYVNQVQQTCQDTSAINYGGALPCIYQQATTPTVSLYANPSTISSGQNSTLSWNSTNATSCSGYWMNSSATSGSGVVVPTVTTNYSITCYGNSGLSATATAIVYVNQTQQQPTVSLYASPTTIQSGQNSTLSWNSTNATSCSGYWMNSSATSGSGVVVPTVTTNYSITCYGNSGLSATATAIVYVNQTQQICQDVNAINYRGTLPCVYNQVNNQPTVVVYSDQVSVPYNGAATVRWITTNASSCYASGGSVGWAGAKSIGPGSFYTGSLTSNKTYTLTCSNSFGSTTDSETVTVRAQTVASPRPTQTSLVLITSSINRNQAIVPTIDNTNPRPGDEINYTVSYQNIGTGSITNLFLRIDLPLEIDYISSIPNNPTIYGNALVFNLGTLRANGEGVVTIKTKVRENISNGTNLNFPATLSYLDPSGQPQSVNANVSAEVSSEGKTFNLPLGANVFGAGFLPTNLFGWLFLLILILVLVFLGKYLLSQSFSKKTTVVTDQLSGKKITTTTEH